jgi:hypothetical protein
MEQTENFVHGLSQLQFHLRSNKALPAWSHAKQSERENVALLDGLALLLVFAPKGDIAATTCWQTGSEVEVLWAKNQPVDDHDELAYIESLIQKAQGGARVADILEIAIPMCRDKILYRIKKLAKSFGIGRESQRQKEANLWQFDATKKPFQKLQATLEEKGFFTGETTIQLLDGFTRRLGETTKTSSVKWFKYLIYFSRAAATVSNLGDVLDAQQVRYLGKLGDYLRVVQGIPKLVKDVKKRNARIVATQVCTVLSMYFLSIHVVANH